MSDAPRPAHRPSRRPEILEAALAEVSASGTQGDFPPMAAIAERAGVTPAAMYYHFASKDDLVVALIELVSPEVLDVVALDDQGSVDEAIDALIDRFAGWVKRSPASARFYFVTAPSLAAPSVQERFDASRRELARRLGDRLQAFDPTASPVTAWLRVQGLLAVLQEAVFLALERQAAPTRGFHAVEKASRQLVAALVSTP